MFGIPDAATHPKPSGSRPSSAVMLSGRVAGGGPQSGDSSQLDHGVAVSGALVVAGTSTVPDSGSTSAPIPAPGSQFPPAPDVPHRVDAFLASYRELLGAAYQSSEAALQTAVATSDSQFAVSPYIRERIRLVVPEICRRLFGLAKRWLQLAGAHFRLMEMRDAGTMPRTLQARIPQMRILSTVITPSEPVTAAFAGASDLLLQQLVSDADRSMREAFAELDGAMPRPTGASLMSFTSLVMRSQSTGVDAELDACGHILSTVLPTYQQQIRRAFDDLFLRARATIVDAVGIMRHRHPHIDRFLRRHDPETEMTKQPAPDPDPEDSTAARLLRLEEEVRRLRMTAPTSSSSDPRGGSTAGRRRRGRRVRADSRAQRGRTQRGREPADPSSRPSPSGNGGRRGKSGPRRRPRR